MPLISLDHTQKKVVNMADTFTFTESCELLQTNAKTFKGWLEKAHIDANQQIDLADPRKKFLTREQLVLLARQHGRTLPSLEVATHKQQMTVTPDMIMEAIAGLQSSTTQIHQSLQQIETLLQTLLTQHTQQQEAAAPGTVQPTSEALEPSPASPAASALEHTSTLRRIEQHKKVAPKSRAKKVKGKPLPRTLVPLRVFAEQHHIPLKIADRACKTGRLASSHGRWLYNSRYVTEALNAESQRKFVELFSSHTDFVSCAHCPHAS